MNRSGFWFVAPFLVLYAAFLIHYMTGDLAFLNQGVSDLKALVGGAR